MENEAAMDSLDIDELFDGDEELFGDNFLDFEDEGGLVLDGNELEIPVQQPSRGGIRTSKGPPPISNKNKRNETPTSNNFDVSPDKDKRREKSKRKRKATTIYTDGGEVSLSPIANSRGEASNINSKLNMPLPSPLTQSLNREIISIGPGSAIASNNNRGNSRKKGRSLPTQRQRNVSKENGNSITGSLFSTGKDIMSEENQMAKSDAVAAKEKAEETFYPFASISQSCLDTSGRNIAKLPQLSKVFLHSKSRSKITVKASYPKRQNPLLQLMGKVVGNNSRSRKKITNSDQNTLPYIFNEASINYSKSLIATASKKSLAADLKTILRDLNQQSLFMTKTLVKLSDWCNESLTKDDSKKEPASKKKSKDSKSKSQQNVPLFSTLASTDAINTGVLPTITHSILNKSITSQSLIKEIPVSVKIKCSALKKHDKKHDRIQALVPSQSAVGIAITLSNYSTLANMYKQIKITKKKRRTATSSTTSINKSSDSRAKKSKKVSRLVPNEKKIFENMDPMEKIKYFSQLLSQQAMRVKQDILNSSRQQEAIFKKQNVESDRLIQLNDVHIYMNTHTLWGVMKSSPYWDTLSNTNVPYALTPVWQHEVPKSDESVVKSSSGESNTSIKTNQVEDTKIDTSEKVIEQNYPSKIPTFSMFDRLQAMLVEEDSDDENEALDKIDDEIETESDDEMDIIDFEEDEIGKQYVFDVSQLSFDERAYIHLRSIHLIDDSCIPSNEPFISKKEIIDKVIHNSPVVENISDDVCGTGANNNADADKLKIHICSEKRKLIEQTIMNNKAVLLLKQKADADIQDQCRKRKVAEQEHILIQKHSKLVARARKIKEEMSTSKQQSSEQQWVPW